MDYTIESETVTDEERSSEERGGHSEGPMAIPEREQLAHDRLLQLLMSAEHHLVHAF